MVCIAIIPNFAGPNAKSKSPKTPYVHVWLSPHAIVVAGSVKPSSGHMICTMRWWREPGPIHGMPHVRTFFLSVSTCNKAAGSERRDLAVLCHGRGVVDTFYNNVSDDLDQNALGRTYVI